jgi:cyclophilin family peptidyl-prolyl cis-trans isomerase
MQTLVGLMAIFSILVPQKMWFAPDQPINVAIKADADVQLVLTDFSGKAVGSPVAATAGSTVDVKSLFSQIAQGGTFILYAVPKGSAAAAPPTDFLGTPLVIEGRQDKRQGGAPGIEVYKVEPLRYAEINTDMGKLTCVFYYDVAPNTVDNFLSLSEGGYYDGVGFHRIVPGFVIQGGDPRWADPQFAGTGGPGYAVGQEFNDHKHLEGVLSMARSSDPDSAGSQFFVCLDYAQTQHLDNQYTAYGKVVDGMDAVKKIAAVKLSDPANGRPEKPPVIQKVDVLAVTKDHNPYAAK